MAKKATIVVLILLIALIGLAVYFFSGSNSLSIIGSNCKDILVTDPTGAPVKDFNALRSIQHVSYSDEDLQSKFGFYQQSDGVHTKLCEVAQ
jgi:hypothetical protein